MSELKWYERKARAVYTVRIGVEAATLEEANAKFEAGEQDDFDTEELVDLKFTSKTKEIG